MGTRADFYVGTGPNAEWLGSVAWDGYEWAESKRGLASCRTEPAFRKAVAKMLAGREDSTLPKDGWPWPWKTSMTTDYAYYFTGKRVSWKERDDWPDMSAIQNVSFGRNSGLIVSTRQRVVNAQRRMGWKVSQAFRSRRPTSTTRTACSSFR